MPTGCARDVHAGALADARTPSGDDVDLKYYWDADYGADEDPGDFIKWIGRVTGYTKK